VYGLAQNYPNPFNPTTTITIALPEASNWKLAIYNTAGQLVKQFEGAEGAATYVSVEWDGTNEDGTTVASGVYLYRVKAGSFTATRKMILLK
jgi:flagellar hook assembly protein FlgD